MWLEQQMLVQFDSILWNHRNHPSTVSSRFMDLIQCKTHFMDIIIGAQSNFPRTMPTSTYYYWSFFVFHFYRSLLHSNIHQRTTTIFLFLYLHRIQIYGIWGTNSSKMFVFLDVFSWNLLFRIKLEKLALSELEPLDMFL